MSTSEITVSELAALGDVLVIDVREIDEYVDGHVPGAINFPSSSLTETFNKIPQGDTVYFVCHGGGRSGRACEYLASLPEFANRHLVNVRGGTSGWIIEGNRVVTGDQPN